MLYDHDIREPLFDFLENVYGKIRILEEKTMGKSRADIVMITEDALYGIEIKSDADTYARLKRQIRDYNKYYDYNFVAVGTSHAMHIEEHVPDFWGIITVDETVSGPDFYILRKPERNLKMNRKSKLSLLWRPELAAIQKMNAMPAYREKSKAFVIEKIVSRIPEEISENDINKQISGLLFERDYTMIAKELDAYKKSRKKT